MITTIVERLNQREDQSSRQQRKPCCNPAGASAGKSNKASQVKAQSRQGQTRRSKAEGLSQDCAGDLAKTGAVREIIKAHQHG